MNGTSVYDLLSSLLPYRLYLVIWMVALPFLALTIGTALKRVSLKTSAGFLAVPVYLSVVPGMGSVIILGYLHLFTGTNILSDIDVALVIGPLACMIATLVAVSKVMPHAKIPGYGRMTGLMIIVGVAFGVALFLSRLRIFIGFFSSLTTLLLLFIAVYVIFKLALKKLKG